MPNQLLKRLRLTGIIFLRCLLFRQYQTTVVAEDRSTISTNTLCHECYECKEFNNLVVGS